VDTVDDLVAEFQKQERCSHLEKSGVRVCVLILGAPFGRGQLVNRLEEAIEWPWVEQAARWEVGIELEALWGSAAQVWDLVLERADWMFSLGASLSSMAELLEGRIDAVVTNRVHWGTGLALAATLSHFPNLGTKLEVLGFEYNVDLMGDLIDALRIEVQQVSDLLATYIPPSATHGCPNDAGAD
jgi:hypothetical protein